MSEGQSSAMTTREGSFEMERAQVTETTAATSEARAIAIVQAAYTLARKFPRDLDTVRQRLLKECERPGFAEKARYSVPRGGKKIEGPSIRFTEAAAQIMGNLRTEVDVIYDDRRKRILRCVVTDLETNTSYSEDISFEKTVERKDPKQGVPILGTRVNSYGDPVFLVEASDDDVNMKGAQLKSKAIRTLQLRLLPGWLVEASMNEVLATQRREDKADPDAARHKLVDSFETIGVLAEDLVKWLGGRPLTTLKPTDIEELRGIFMAIKERAITWPDAMATSPYAVPGEVDTKGADKGAVVAEKVKDVLAKKAAGKGGLPQSSAAPVKPPTAKTQRVDDGTLPPGQDGPPEPGSDG